MPLIRGLPSRRKGGPSEVLAWTEVAHTSFGLDKLCLRQKLEYDRWRMA